MNTECSIGYIVQCTLSRIPIACVYFVFAKQTSSVKNYRLMKNLYLHIQITLRKTILGMTKMTHKFWKISSIPFFLSFVNVCTICRKLWFVEPQKNPFVCFGELQWWHVYCFKQINKSYVLIVKTMYYIHQIIFLHLSIQLQKILVLQSNWAKNLQDRKCPY